MHLLRLARNSGDAETEKGSGRIGEWQDDDTRTTGTPAHGDSRTGGTRARRGAHGTRNGPLGSAPRLPRFAPIPRPLEKEEYPLPLQGGIQIFVRAFAPFETFGGGYSGDDRQATTDTSATAKIRWVFTFDVATMRQVDKSDTSSDPSHAHGWFPSLMAYSAPLSAKFHHDGTIGGKANSTSADVVESVGRPGTGFVLTGDLAGANPLVGAAADIDVQVSIKVIKREVSWNSPATSRGRVPERRGVRPRRCRRRGHAPHLRDRWDRRDGAVRVFARPQPPPHRFVREVGEGRRITRYPFWGILGDTPSPAPADYEALWARDAERLSATFGPALNAHRASLGMSPVGNVRRYVFTERPWLAADRVYFGFGSIRAAADLGQVMVASSRAAWG